MPKNLKIPKKEINRLLIILCHSIKNSKMSSTEENISLLSQKLKKKFNFLSVLILNFFYRIYAGNENRKYKM